MQQNYVLSTSLSNENTTEPVLLAEMKTYLRINLDETFSDPLITQLIITARQQLEAFLNISLISKTVTARLQNETGSMQLPYAAETNTITSVTDDAGKAVTGYTLKGDSFTANASTNAWAGNNYYSPCNTAVTVVYTVSYPNGLPVQFKTAIMQQVAWLYERRGDEMTTALSPLVKLSMKPYRKVY